MEAQGAPSATYRLPPACRGPTLRGCDLRWLGTLKSRSLSPVAKVFIEHVLGGVRTIPQLKLYIYGYLNRIQSGPCLEREAKRNLEVIWLIRRLMPDDVADPLNK